MIAAVNADDYTKAEAHRVMGSNIKFDDPSEKMNAIAQELYGKDAKTLFGGGEVIQRIHATANIEEDTVKNWQDNFLSKFLLMEERVWMYIKGMHGKATECAMQEILNDMPALRLVHHIICPAAG